MFLINGDDSTQKLLIFPLLSSLESILRAQIFRKPISWQLSSAMQILLMQISREPIFGIPILREPIFRMLFLQEPIFKVLISQELILATQTCLKQQYL